MGVARLLAKGWIVLCLVAGGHALHLLLAQGGDPADALPGVVVPVLLFAAMGLLFIGGFGASGAQVSTIVSRFKPHHLIPGFNETVFLAFVLLSFVNQVFFAPDHLGGPLIEGLEAALAFAVPGQRALIDALTPCGLDGGRIFASGFAWLLAIIYLASAGSRLRLAAGIIRIERVTMPEPMGALALTVVLGIAAIAGIQFLYIGSAYPLLDCSAFTDIPGALLVGLAPLMLSYLVVAALASAMATGPE
jgi:hypothetical protein